MAAFPRIVSVTTASGKQMLVTTFYEPLSESQRKWFEQEELRITRWARWGIETPEGDMTWQICALAMLTPWFIAGAVGLF